MIIFFLGEGNCHSPLLQWRHWLCHCYRHD